MCAKKDIKGAVLNKDALLDNWSKIEKNEPPKFVAYSTLNEHVIKLRTDDEFNLICLLSDGIASNLFMVD